MTARKKPAKKKLKLEKRALEDEPDDLPVSEEEAEDIKGGFAPPYVPVMPSRSIKEQVARPNLPGGLPGSEGTKGG